MWRRDNFTQLSFTFKGHALPWWQLPAPSHQLPFAFALDFHLSVSPSSFLAVLTDYRMFFFNVHPPIPCLTFLLKVLAGAYGRGCNRRDGRVRAEHRGCHGPLMRINAEADMQRGAGNGEDQSLSFLVTTQQFIRICLLALKSSFPGPWRKEELEVGECRRGGDRGPGAGTVQRTTLGDLS